MITIRLECPVGVLYYATGLDTLIIIDRTIRMYTVGECVEMNEPEWTKAGTGKCVWGGG